MTTRHPDPLALAKAGLIEDLLPMLELKDDFGEDDFDFTSSKDRKRLLALLRAQRRHWPAGMRRAITKHRGVAPTQRQVDAASAPRVEALDALIAAIEHADAVFKGTPLVVLHALLDLPVNNRSRRRAQLARQGHPACLADARRARALSGCACSEDVTCSWHLAHPREDIP